MRHTAAEKCELDGYKFASRAERRRYVQLRELERAGRLTNLRVHPRFEIRGPHGAIIASGWFEADFSYLLDGARMVVEDVKGRRFRDWPTRRDLFADNYPDWEFYEVRAARCPAGFEAKRVERRMPKCSR